MTANDSEHAGEPSDAVAEFALWLQELRRQAGKPSYAQVVRRSRRRYPHATVRESTISDMLNGKRLPRWETVEPVAWALGGEEAVAACRQRWIEADMARTPPVPLAPPVPPPALEVPSAQEVPQGQAVVEPSRCPDTEPLPAAVPELTGGAPVQAGAAKEPAVLVRRRRWPFVAGGAVVAAAALACVFLLPGNGHRPHPGASATGLATPTRSRTAGQNTAKASLSPSSVPQPAWTPGTAMLTAHSSRPARTRDGLVTISVLSVDGNNIPGVVYSVITPWTTCQVSGGDVGQSVVIKRSSDTWIRLVIIDFPETTHTDAASTDFDIPIDFQITRGQGPAPRTTQKCT